MPGGVCAVLDYEVELMAEYVAEMTTRLAVGTATAPAAFRKFISQILSSTRLPSTTILLGMNYLAKRINMMTLSGQQAKMSEGQIWRMLTVALLLGSKFLDDNTFQNRSWAEVSGIPVRELNTLENEWMGAIEWSLYVNLDRSGDYNAWLKSWKDWCNNKKLQQQHALASRERLASLSPMQTEVSRSRTWHQQQVAEYEHYERLSNNKRNDQTHPSAYSSRDATWSTYQPQPVGWPASPLTPPDSGYGTPEYLNSATSVNAQYNDWFGQQAQQAQQTNRTLVNNNYSRPQQYTQQQSSNYHSRNSSNMPYNFYGHSIWGDHNVDCSCMSCVSSLHKQQPYFGTARSYGQPVMG